MNSLSVVIPSRTLSNFLPCAEAVRRHEPTARIICIDDGLEGFKWTEELMPAMGAPGIKPFVFSRNINLGIRLAGDDDVVLLNDDALLQTPGGFTLMQQAAAERPEFGIMASTTNNVGNQNQLRQRVGVRVDPRQLCFVCVLIPRRTIDTVGFLDERFTAYGFDDDDYCYRVRRAGLKLGIHDGCFVDHSSLPSTFRSGPHASAGLGDGRQIFIEKWGSYPL